MDKRKLNDDEMGIDPNALVKVTTMKHIVEIQFMERINNKAHIKKLDANRYVDLKTGDIREFERTENRSQGENSLRKTFNRLRELINTNFDGAANELFVTLTYRGELQTNDPKIVYEDFKRFIKRLKYTYRNETSIDYINVLEPHESGNFHMHVLFRFNDLNSIYIPNEVNRATGESINAPLRDLWGNGNVTISSLKHCDNIGAYLSAYLSDIEVPDTLSGHFDVIEKEVEGQKKKFMKKDTGCNNICQVTEKTTDGYYLEIGNDVWIGNQVLLKGGIKIGTGAVVAMGAVVTKDVPPYAIIAGVPGKIIGYRFSENIIKRLLQLKWWDFTRIQLEAARPLFDGELTEEKLDKLFAIKNS